MPGPDILPVETQAMLDQLRKIESPDYIVCSGSKPTNVPDDIFARIAALAKEKKARFIFDSSGAALKAGLRNGAFLIKPNRGELCALAGKEWLADGDIEKAAREVLAQYSVDAMLVSLGADGALLVAKDQLVRIKPPSVERQSTVGAGDSMVAGLVWQLSNGSDLRQAAGYGVACGTAATLNPGTQLCRKEDADKIFEALEWA
jgi:6-phosphofructokinase 2